MPSSIHLATPTRTKKRDGHAKVKRSHSDTVTTFPPPPPTSPTVSPRGLRADFSTKYSTPLSVETHVLGVDGGSTKLRYSMHINLHKLQQNVAEAENSEPEGVNSNFKSAFQRKTPRKPTSKATKIQLSPPKAKGKGEKTMPLTSAKESDTTTSINKKIPSDGDEKKEKPASDRQAVTVDLETSSEINVTGRTVQAVPHNFIADMITSRREDGERIRNAEKEIKETVAKTKQPPLKPEKTTSMSKDELSFTRAYTTMTLSALKAVEKVHEARKKTDALIQKVNLVSKMKQERMERREKIEEFHRSLRESINNWRAEKDDKLTLARQLQRMRREEDILRRSHSHDTAITNMHRQSEDQKFACEFSQQNTLVSSTLSKEDRKLSQDSKLQGIKEKVQQAREVSKEHQEMVKRYMELREAKLLQEGLSAKEELDAKMLEVQCVARLFPSSTVCSSRCSGVYGDPL